jgi:hypothetical protein
MDDSTETTRRCSSSTQMTTMTTTKNSVMNNNSYISLPTAVDAVISCSNQGNSQLIFHPKFPAGPLVSCLDSTKYSCLQVKSRPINIVLLLMLNECCSNSLNYTTLHGSRHLIQLSSHYSVISAVSIT